MSKVHDHDHDHHQEHHGSGEPPTGAMSRRKFIKAGAVAAGATAAAATTAGIPIGKAQAAGLEKYADPANPLLPPSNMVLDMERVALVVTDPQVDFLSPTGVTWEVVGESVTELNTVENIGRLFSAAKKAGITVAVSPHYYFPTDHGWAFEGSLEKLMHGIGMFDRDSVYDGLKEGAGHDFLARYKKDIFDGETLICSPHKIYGPEQNDLVLQLRKKKVDQVILAGMSANLCTQAHLHELLELGFEVAVIKDATAAAKLPEGDGYLAALINFRFIANAVWTTDEVVALLGS